MQRRTVKGATFGPWLVGLGAALWGTESAWRIPLNELFDAKVIVFWEHVFILIMFLPILISRMNEIPKISARTWGYLIFSGFAGSAVGTIFFTLALKYGNPTVVNVILNIDRKSTRLNSSHDQISYAVFCLKKKKKSYARSETDT